MCGVCSLDNQCGGLLLRAYIRELQRCLASESVWQPDSTAHQRLTKLVKTQRAAMMLFMRVGFFQQVQ